MKVAIPLKSSPMSNWKNSPPLNLLKILVIHLPDSNNNKLIKNNDETTDHFPHTYFYFIACRFFVWRGGPNDDTHGFGQPCCVTGGFCIGRFCHLYLYQPKVSDKRDRYGQTLQALIERLDTRERFCFLI